MPETPHEAAHDTAPRESGPASVPAVRRLASWLRRAHRPAPSAATPPHGLRPQPEDDASVYPLF
ncbi:hypothetical protein ACFYN9_21295 [Streptomyces collinus]|uniref:Uncharacterized protein n=1 Tax=Streptomyces violaceochromogenes TaxID=67377 RepID=A0ABU6LSE3_9ACTN|nr:hypothetical protein [Streptomyces violaceochromogenes]MEC7050814.1 hypothetical protein [Streptomyces violaceochromogenes]GHC84904.1 hypothetical protein GCM10010309_62950 [Streptomyces violaceochromogenes]